jgi:hypothetical protein
VPSFVALIKAENQEFVEFGRSMIAQSALCGRRFLIRMEKACFACSGEWSLTLISNRVVGAVDAYNATQIGRPPPRLNCAT